MHKFYYQEVAQQISLIHIHRKLLQHVSAVSYSHLQGALSYRGYVWSKNLMNKSKHKMHCKCIITIPVCDVDSIYRLKLNRTQIQVHPDT
jgi:hypothetical protein